MAPSATKSAGVQTNASFHGPSLPGDGGCTCEGQELASRVFHSSFKSSVLFGTIFHRSTFTAAALSELALWWKIKTFSQVQHR